MSEKRCPVCGMSSDEWQFEGGAGYRDSYCCPGCANGTGCECQVESIDEIDDEEDDDM
ncbi:MAG: hypothetical protein AB7N71_00445 [Phycisphaerae bacterium]